MRDSKPYDFGADEIEHDPLTDTYHLSFGPEQIQAPAMVIVQLVSYITETSPLSLPQLHSSIETDSLNSWFSASEEPRTDFEIGFPYAGFLITLDSTGELSVQPIYEAGSTDEDESG